MSFLKRLRCRLGWCGGDVCSGWHGPRPRILWMGWICRECRVVKHYEPTEIVER